MEFSAQQIAQLLNGTVEGDDNVLVNNMSKIEEGLPNTLSFLANAGVCNTAVASKVGKKICTPWPKKLPRIYPIPITICMHCLPVA